METCAVVKDVRVLGGFRLEIAFADGLRGALDFRQRLAGRRGVFEALQDPSYFATVRVEQDLGTIVWPNGADFCPDMLYEWVKGGVLQSAK